MTALNPKTLFGDLLIALAFFTRLPVPPFEIRDRTLGQALWAAPLAGLAVALIGALAFTLCDALGMTSALAAAVALAVMMLTTGCLHEDGLADTADAFGGHKTMERKLEILRDSRIGTYGAAALMASMLIRWAAIASLTDGATVVCALIAAQMASRGVFGIILRHTPLARDSGLARSVGAVPVETAVVALAIGAASLLVIGLAGAILAAAIAAAALWSLQRLAIDQIGGVTGDTLGAAQQVAEIAVLAVASAMLS